MVANIHCLIGSNNCSAHLITGLSVPYMVLLPVCLERRLLPLSIYGISKLETALVSSRVWFILKERITLLPNKESPTGIVASVLR